MVIFDKNSFTKNAEPHIKKLIPAAHIAVLNGMEVKFGNGRFGIIPHYEVDGKRFHLYPVPHEWCSECNQLSLFGIKGGNL